MKKTVVGVFETYSKAEEVVEDLETAGINGEEVEVISDADHDARSASLIPDSGRNEDEGPGGKISHMFGSHPSSEKHVSNDFADEQASRSGRTIVIVRASDDQLAERAADILRMHGAEKGGPITTLENGNPGVPVPQATGGPADGLGAPGVTTGPDAADLEAKGKVLRARGR